jgi:hypothetical protein
MTSRMTNLGPTQYHISVLNISNFRAYFSEEWPEISVEHGIRDEEYELFYDWTVTHSFACHLKMNHGVELSGTYRHEIYEMAASKFFQYLYSFFLGRFDDNKINFRLASTAKAMVAGDLLTIAIGTNPYV